MTEYIERGALPKRKERGFFLDDDFNAGWNACLNNISSIPAADVRPAVRGRWIDAIQSCHDSPHVKCSVCGEFYWQYFKKFSFCPNCGADMREESHEEENR